MNYERDILNVTFNRLPSKSTPTVPSTEYVHDYVIAAAILFPVVIFLLVANVLMFTAVLDMILSRGRDESCGGAVLVLNLAIADCLLGVASLLAISDAVNPDRPLTSCLITMGFIAMATMASCLIMAGIAFERYKTIRMPFRQRKNDTPKVIAATFVIWIASALVGFAPFMGWQEDNPYNDQQRCLFLTAVPPSYILFVFLGIYLPTLTSTAYLHIVMCQASRRQGRKIAACEILPSCSHASQSNRETRARDRLRTEMTDVHSPTYTENALDGNHTERVLTVAGKVDEKETANTPYGPIEIIADGHPMCNFIETNDDNRNDVLDETYDGRNDSNSSNNLPRIWNTIRPEKWSRTVILILGFFVCMWTPFWIVCVMQAVCVSGTCHYEDLASTYLFVLGVSNSAVNPVVYISTDKKLKEHFCQCFFRSADSASNDDSSSVFLSG